MDGLSPIDGFLTGRLGENELLAAVEQIVTSGSFEDRTLLLSDWRTKSGRIRATGLRRKLDATVAPLAWDASIVADAGAASREPARQLEPGDIVANRFVIVERIGSGGMSSVFKARDLRREEAEDRQPFIAIKTLNNEVLQREDSVKILQREARKAQGLSHPNIVRIYDFDRDGDTLFITMELLEGKSLDQIIQERALRGANLESMLPILRQVVSALEFAHAEGIVHCDLKPANIIMLPNGRVKVIDFGISRAIPSPNQTTDDRTKFNVSVLGALTPAYASPEMIDGLDPQPADDVFALACIVYECLAGRHPFGRAPASVARAGNFIPKPPPMLSPSQWAALMAGFCFDRARRTATPGQLLRGLEVTGHDKGMLRSPMPNLKGILRKEIPHLNRMLQRSMPILLGVSAVAVLVGIGWYLLADLGVIWPGHRQSSTTRVAGASTPPQIQNQQQETARTQPPQKAAELPIQSQTTPQSPPEDTSRRQDAAQADVPQKAAEAAQQPLADEQAARREADQQAASRVTAQPVQKPAEAETQGQSDTQADQAGGSHIIEAQMLLARMGLTPGTADGKVGPRTREMLQAFQLAIGQSPTGALTPSLLNALRGEAPPPLARGKALFSLAAVAARGQRPQDAARLYQQGLRFAPRDVDALLALGDVQRTLGDTEAARQSYRTAQQSGAADSIVAARLASLTIQQSPMRPETEAGLQLPSPSEPARQEPIPREQVVVDPSHQFDGTYSGTQNITGYSSPNCRPSSPVTIVVTDNNLRFGQNVTTQVTPDGRFSAYNPVGTPPVAQHLVGTIRGSVIEAKTIDPSCEYHMSLRKIGG
jgi:serine/threonine protein kinase/peptidoglycan hydrolase-like protein with peptidoglycan-binding domain